MKQNIKLLPKVSYLVIMFIFYYSQLRQLTNGSKHGMKV